MPDDNSRVASAEPELPPPDPEPLEERGGDPQGLCPVVGIGASAGGLEAFSDLLSGLSSSTGMAFVLVQHLDPHHESALVELLTRQTPMPLVQAADGMTVEPDAVTSPPSANQLRAGPRRERRARGEHG